MALKKTLVTQVFEALPAPHKLSPGAPIGLNMVYQRLPDLTRQQINTALHALCNEDSVRRLPKGPESWYSRLYTERPRREYVPKQGVAYKGAPGPGNPILAQALERAQAEHGPLDTTPPTEDERPAEHAALVFDEFRTIVGRLEARMHRLLLENNALRDERDRYKAILEELSQRIDSAGSDSE